MKREKYLDPELEPQERARELLGQMTLEEKLAQLGCAWIWAFLDGDGFSAGRASEVAPQGIGEVTRISGATALGPGETAALVNDLQRHIRDNTRLAIPVLVHEEGTGGFLARGATVFPQALALAATFDADLVKRVASVIAEQMRAVGARHCLAPVLDVARDPRWGRVEETFGEDPILAGTIGAAYVAGLQGEDLRTGVLATGKHFLAHALPEGGRNHAPVQVGPRELREVYAEPFAAAINTARLGSVMNSYSAVDGLPPAGSRQILTELLRDELGFSGIVVADYFAVSLLIGHHHVAADQQEAATLAITAGLDIELPETACYGEPLRAAVNVGSVSMGTIDTAVSRVLAAKFALGLFEEPVVDAARALTAFDTLPQRSLARRAAIRSITLLANDGILPLSRDLSSIAVIGPGADDEVALQGDYHYPAHLRRHFQPGSVPTVNPSGQNLEVAPPTLAGDWRPGRYFTAHITPRAGLRSLLGESTDLLYARGCDVTGNDTSGIEEAVGCAQAAEVAVVVVAGRSGIDITSTVGEARDATDLRLTGAQEMLVEAVSGTGTPTVVVVLSGRVHDLSAVEPQARALLQAWPLGEEGGAALAEVLLGVTGPSGRLPVSLPRSVGQVPRYSSHRRGGSISMFYSDYTDNLATPLFPFGHGLTFTSFEYGDLDALGSDTTSSVILQLAVTNTGSRFGEEVVQLYMTDLVASVVRPEQQLIGFARVPLEPGEQRRLRFEVHPSRLALFDTNLRRVTEPGDFRFAAGSSSSDLRAAVTVGLGGATVHYPWATLSETIVTLI